MITLFTRRQYWLLPFVLLGAALFTGGCPDATVPLDTNAAGDPNDGDAGDDGEFGAEPAENYVFEGSCGEVLPVNLAVLYDADGNTTYRHYTLAGLAGGTDCFGDEEVEGDKLFAGPESTLRITCPTDAYGTTVTIDFTAKADNDPDNGVYSFTFEKVTETESCNVTRTGEWTVVVTRADDAVTAEISGAMQQTDGCAVDPFPPDDFDVNGECTETLELMEDILDQINDNPLIEELLGLLGD
jgi:hypothetical protein